MEGGGVRRSPPSWASILRKERKFSTDFNFSTSQPQQPSVFDNFDKQQENSSSHENEEERLPPTHPKKNKGLRMCMTDGAFNNTISQAINKIEDKIDVVGASYHHHHHRRASFGREVDQGPSVIVSGSGVLECRGGNRSNGSNSSGGCSRSSSTISVCSSGGGRSSVSPLSEDLSLALLMRSPSEDSTTPGVQDLSLRRRTSQDEEEIEFGVRCRDIRYLLEDDDELPQDLSIKKTEPKIFKQGVEDLSVKRRKFTPPPPLTYDFGNRPPLISYDLSNSRVMPVSLPSQERSVISSAHYSYDGSGRNHSSVIEVKILQQQLPPPAVVLNGISSSNSNGGSEPAEGELMIIEDFPSTRNVIQRRRSTGGAEDVVATVYSPEVEEPRPESVSSTRNENATLYDSSSITATITSEAESGEVVRRKRGRRRKVELEPGEVVKSFDCFLCNFTASKEAVLMAHLNRMHTVKGNRGNVRCTVCAYSSPTIEELRAHQEQAHSFQGGGGGGGGDGNAAGEEMKVAFHACHHCSKKFRSEGQRQAHLRLIAQKQVWKEMKVHPPPRNP